jgi:hypothetical protein
VALAPEISEAFHNSGKTIASLTRTFSISSLCTFYQTVTFIRQNKDTKKAPQKCEAKNLIQQV